MTVPPLDVAVGETVPHGGTGHDTVQVTPLFAESLVTVAENCVVAPACTVAVACDIDTLIAGGAGGGGGLAELPPQPKLVAAMTAARRITISDR